MKKTRPLAFFHLWVFSIIGLLGNSGGDWPQWLGPDQNSKIRADGVISGKNNVALRVAWKIPIGSSYSGIAISGGRVFTHFSDGTSDFLLALAEDTGKELWRYRIAKTYKGHDSSADGPLGTPVVAGEMVYGFGPWGHLYGVDVKSGKAVWEIDSAEKFGVTRPRFGITSSPVVFENLLIVQLGGKDSYSICAFDRNSGELKWNRGSEQVGYSTPMVTTLLGKKQVVSITDSHLTGLEPATGKVLWSQEYREPNSNHSGQITRTAENRFLVFAGPNYVLYELTERDGAIFPEEKWQTTQLRGVFCVPIFHQGYLYGMSRHITTCINAETGERVWKSREPGSGRMIMVDGHMVIWGPEGWLHLAKASPAGYEGVASLKVLDQESLTTPSYANGKIYVRNTESIAAVEIVEGRSQLAKVAPGTIPEPTAGSAFGRFIAGLDNETDKQAAVDAYLERQKSFPLVEDGNLVHFVFQAESADADVIMNAGHIRLFGEPMEQVPGTNLFYRSFRIDPGVRIEYRYAETGKRPGPDPRNQKEAAYLNGTSEILTQGFNYPDFVAEPAENTARGKLEEMVFENSLAERTLHVYLPAGYEEGNQKYPLVVFVDGGAAKDAAGMPAILDNLIATGKMRPVVAVFLPVPQDNFRNELVANDRGKFGEMMAKEMIPALEAKYRLQQSREQRLLVGASFGAFNALYSAIRLPEIFGNAAVLSIWSYGPYTRILNEVSADKSGPKARIQLVWCQYDSNDQIREIYPDKESQAIAGMLKDRGYPVTTLQLPGSHGWGTWRLGMADVLAEFFQP